MTDLTRLLEGILKLQAKIGESHNWKKVKLDGLKMKFSMVMDKWVKMSKRNIRLSMVMNMSARNSNLMRAFSKWVNFKRKHLMTFQTPLMLLMIYSRIWMTKIKKRKRRSQMKRSKRRKKKHKRRKKMMMQSFTKS